MSELEQAKATVAAYRAMKGKASPPEYMAYMRARGVLDKHGVERLTAGQRGFLASVRSLGNGDSEAQP